MGRAWEGGRKISTAPPPPRLSKLLAQVQNRLGPEAYRESRRV